MGEGEGLKREEEEAVDERKEEGIGEISAESHGGNGGLEVGIIFSFQVEFKQLGLYEADEGQ